MKNTIGSKEGVMKGVVRKPICFAVAIFFLLSQVLGGSVFIPSAYAELGLPETGPAPQPTVSATGVSSSSQAAPHDHPEDSPISAPTMPADPHPHAADEGYVLNLVKHEDATRTITGNVKWSEAGFRAGEKIVVAEGATLEVDGVDNTVIKSMRVDGTLTFATDRNTGITIDTLVVSHMGALFMGTEDDPIARGVTAKITFEGRTAIDLTLDPRAFGRGLISLGMAHFYGASKTPYAEVAMARRGDTTLTVSNAENWEVGDKVVLTGAKYGEQEERTIAAVSGNMITLDRSLTFDHIAPEEGLKFHLGNLTRNIVLESEDYGNKLGRAGHVMFMHSGHTEFVDAASLGNGRTDKAKRLDSALRDEQGQLIDPSKTNFAGRYGLHFHRMGTSEGTQPGVVKRAVVAGNQKGWGFVNHSSNVHMEKNVAYANRTGFTAEAGNEIGIMKDNLAIGVQAGASQARKDKGEEESFGRSHNGFWSQGAGIKYENNIAANFNQAGIIFWGQGLRGKNGQTTFTAFHALDPATRDAIVKGFKGKVRTEIATEEVPIRLDGFTSYGHLGSGGEILFHGLGVGRSRVENFTAWNVLGEKSTNRGGALSANYSHNIDFKNIWLRGNPADPRGSGISHNVYSSNINYENVHIVGFRVGINRTFGENKNNSIRGGYLNNVTNIHIQGLHIGRTLTIDGVIFGSLSESALKGRKQWDIYREPLDFNPANGSIARLFQRQGKVIWNGQEIYRLEQDPNYVFDQPTLPDQIRGKRHGDLWSLYRLALGTKHAPADAVTHERINGLVGSPTPELDNMFNMSPVFTNKLEGYIPRLQFEGKRGVTTGPAVTLLANQWNFIKVNDKQGNFVGTTLVYADTIAPTIELQRTNRVLKPSELAKVKLGYMVIDQIGNIRTSRKKTKVFTDLMPDAEGKVWLTFTATDLAGNVTTLTADFTVGTPPPAPVPIPHHHHQQRPV